MKGILGCWYKFLSQVYDKHKSLWACLAWRHWLGAVLGRSRGEHHLRPLAWAGTLWNNVCLGCHCMSTIFIIASALLLVFFITGRSLFFTACSSLLLLVLDPLQKMQDNSVCVVRKKATYLSTFSAVLNPVVAVLWYGKLQCGAEN